MLNRKKMAVIGAVIMSNLTNWWFGLVHHLALIYRLIPQKCSQKKRTAMIWNILLILF